MMQPTIEEMKTEWKRMGFPKLKSSKMTDGNVNDPTSQPLPEHWLWVQLILESVDDLRGTSQLAKQNCRACHVAAPCGCLTLAFKTRQVIKINGKSEAWRVKVPESQRCYVIGPGLCDLQPDGETYHYKRLSSNCKFSHTYMACARIWFASHGFETACGLLNLDVSYMRRRISRIKQGESWEPSKPNVQ